LTLESSGGVFWDRDRFLIWGWCVFEGDF